MEDARRQSAARRALLGLRRPRGRQRDQAGVRRHQPGSLQLVARTHPVLAEGAGASHWPVLLTVTSPVPRWATSNKKAPYVTRPDQRDFQEFMTAVGARSSARRSSVYSIWNEPNHPAFLMPQWNSNGTPASPRIYRGLYQAGYAGLQAAGLSTSQGAVRRDRADRLRQGQPQARRLAGAAARRRAARVPARSAVPERALPARRLVRQAADERLRAPRLHEGRQPALGQPETRRRHDRLALAAVRRARPCRARAGAIPSHLPIYLTEFGVQSFPNQTRRRGRPSRPNTTRSPSTSRGRTRASPRSRSTCSRTTRSAANPARASRAASVGFQTGLSTSAARPSRSTPPGRCR